MIKTIPCVTLTEVKDFCQIREETTQFDASLKLLSATAMEQIEELTQRFFTRQEVTERHTTRDNSDMVYSSNPDATSGVVRNTRPQTVFLKGVNIDVNSFDVRYDPLFAFGDDTRLVEGVDYILNPDEDTLTLLAATKHTQRGLRVTYTAGFASAGTPETISASAPAAIKQAALFQVQFLRVKSRPDNVGMGVERTTGSKDKTISTPFLSKGRLTPEAMSLVTRYKRVRVGRG
jgi:hypothetical protein